MYISILRRIMCWTEMGHFRGLGDPGRTPLLEKWGSLMRVHPSLSMAVYFPPWDWHVPGSDFRVLFSSPSSGLGSAPDNGKPCSWWSWETWAMRPSLCMLYHSQYPLPLGSPPTHVQPDGLRVMMDLGDGPRDNYNTNFTWYYLLLLNYFMDSASYSPIVFHNPFNKFFKSVISFLSEAISWNFFKI